MATKKSKPQTRSRRNPIPSPAAPPLNFEALHEHLEQERGHLMDAEAVLDCVVIALEEDDRMDASGPCYSSVIRIVRGLVRVAIDRLDSVNVKAVLAQHSYPIETIGSKKHFVKEAPPLQYVHYQRCVNGCLLPRRFLGKSNL